jgi:taurine dioxygenase
MPKLIAGPIRLNRMPQGVDSEPYRQFTVTPLSPTIGAVLGDIDLRGPFDDETVAELHRALLEWKVIFFRDQHLTSAEHRDFASMWGELEVHPFLPQGETPEVVRFAKGVDEKGYENIWHSDVSWREVPSLGSVLRAVEVPPIGGDTLWCDMYAAYEGLPTDVRDRIEGLEAMHDFSTSFGALMEPDALAEMQERYPAVAHPVVRTHPDTGRKLLYVNGIFTTHVVGMDTAESDALLELLFAQSKVPEYQCRFHWEAGSLAFWDNRSTQHYACSDYYPSVRVMERATIIGDRPT